MDKGSNEMLFQELINKDGKRYFLTISIKKNMELTTYILTIFEYKRFLLFFSKKNQVLRTVSHSENATLSAMIDLGRYYINNFS
jgi:hypothetical protein